MDPSKTPFDDPDFSGKSEGATGQPSSATGIFGTVSSVSTSSEEDLLKSLMKQADAPASAEVTQAVPQNPLPPQTASPVMPLQTFAPPAPSDLPASASPGEFTQMLKALNTAPSVTSVPAKPAADLASVFKQVSFEKSSPPEPIAPPAVPLPGSSASSPGSFTQMFSTLTAKAVEEQAAKPVPQFSQPATPEPAPVSSSRPGSDRPESGPGDFTKMFQAMRTESQPFSVSPAAPPDAGSNSASPGSASSDSAGPGSASSGSFTQMFSTFSPASASQPDPLKSLQPEPKPEPDRASDFQFTSPLRPVEPPAQGGFTQLLQALNQETAPVKAPEPLAPLAAPNPAPVLAAGGGFTQLLRTLSAEPTSQPEAPPVLPPAPQAAVPPPASSGPSEFTRVISGSALRDLQGQSSVPGPPIAAAPAGHPAFAPPQLPKAPAVPHMPQIPQIPHAAPHAGAAAPPPMPHFAPPAFAFPPVPAPPGAPAAPEPGKIQKYLPLILVLNVFVLLVIVLILFFALHHK